MGDPGAPPPRPGELAMNDDELILTLGGGRAKKGLWGGAAKRPLGRVKKGLWGVGEAGEAGKAGGLGVAGE